MRKSPKFSPEVIERAVRMVFDGGGRHQRWHVLRRLLGDYVAVSCLGWQNVTGT